MLVTGASAAVSAEGDVWALVTEGDCPRIGRQVGPKVSSLRRLLLGSNAGSAASGCWRGRIVAHRDNWRRRLGCFHGGGGAMRNSNRRACKGKLPDKGCSSREVRPL